MHGIGASIAYWLADYLAASTLLLLGVLLAWRSVAQPARRMVLARAALVGLALLAVASFVPGWPRWSLIPSPPSAESPQTDSPTAAVNPVPPSPLPLETPATPASADRQPAAHGPEASPAAQATGPAAIARRVPWPAGFVAVQGLVGLAAALWLVWGAVQTERLRRGAVDAPADMQAMLREIVGHARLPRLLVSPAVRHPVALGLLRPSIVLPGDLAAAPDAQGLRAALAHEWAHLRNGDLWLLALGRYLLPLLAIHPLYHLLWRRIRDDQETLADAEAAGADRPAYAEELLRWARRVVQSPAARFAAVPGICESPSQLSRRIAMLLDDRLVVETRCSDRWRYRSLAVAAGVVLIVSLFTFRPAISSQASAEEKGRSMESAQPKPGAEKAQALTYTGTVTEKGTGKPIAGATVTIRRSILAPYERRLLEETQHKTDAAGKYTFTIPPEQVAQRYLYIERDVSHPDYAPSRGIGYALSMIRKNETMGESPFFARIELLPGESITGTVVTPEGQPAAGMKVLGYSMRDRRDFETASFSPGTTDEKGVFRINLVKEGDAVFWLLPKQYAPSTHVLHKQRGDLGKFVLRPGITVKGRVVDQQGKSVGGVWVNAWITGGAAKREHNLPVVEMLARAGLTDPQGEFTLAPLAAGEYVVNVEEYPQDGLIQEDTPRPLPTVFGPQSLTLKTGETPASIEIRAMAEVVVEGQYYDSHGKPRSGHRPMVVGQMPGQKFGTPLGFFHTQGEVGPNGEFAIRTPKGLQEAKLTFSTNEHSALRVRMKKDGPLVNQIRDIDLGTLTDDIRGIEVVRYEAPILQVKPVAEDGSVLRDAKLRFEYGKGRSRWEGGGRYVEGYDVSYERQPDGRLRSSQLLPDEEFTVTVQAEGRQSKSETLQLPEGAVKELEVKLPKN
jgi:beta-lactamase regulating signal transducer with metallopeptidase domain